MVNMSSFPEVRRSQTHTHTHSQTQAHTYRFFLALSVCLTQTSNQKLYKNNPQHRQIDGLHRGKSEPRQSSEPTSLFEWNLTCLSLSSSDANWLITQGALCSGVKDSNKSLNSVCACTEMWWCLRVSWHRIGNDLIIPPGWERMNYFSFFFFSFHSLLSFLDDTTLYNTHSSRKKLCPWEWFSISVSRRSGGLV